jgi:hypothetical protein
VPKLLDGGVRNGVVCDGIEHKMGLHGSPTCVLTFESARGWLVGDIDGGLRAMFPMMNEARLLSGLQAVGIGESALQNSLRYARERLQGRSAAGVQPCPLIEHPDVQRMLMTQKAWVEGGRAFVHWTALLIDMADWHPDAAVRTQSSALAGLLTPIVKGFLAENAQQSVSLALQVFGGHGYVTDTGLEQLARDVRITTIYEGTTGIQAQDLLLRKVQSDEGQRLGLLQAMVQSWIEGPEARRHGAEFSAPLMRLLELVATATSTLTEREAQARGSSLLSSVDYLRLLGHLVLAYLWAKMAVATHRPDNEQRTWAKAKRATAHFYFDRLLPEADSLSQAIASPPADYASMLST